MSYKYSFSDNAEYGATDVNGIVQRLVASGVADPFTDGAAYNASKLNDVIHAVYDPGVVPEDVNTLKVTKQSDGVVTIAPGLAFFADGSTIEVTAAETLSYEAGVKNYVYLKQDLAAQNRNYPVCASGAPTGDYVLLAEIAADGTVTDKRTYAKGKVPGYQSNANVCMVSEQMVTLENKTAKFTIDMGTNNYSQVFSIAKGSNDGQMGVYSLTDGSYFSVCKYGTGGYNMLSTEFLFVRGGSGYAGLTFSRSGNVLTGRISSSQNGACSFTLVLC